MDGAIVLDRDATRILRAAVHLMPDPTIPTEESGTRHRTAERVAKQTGFPVISVSQSMQIIALYVDGTALRPRGLRRDPVPGQPGAGHPGALQAAPRRGRPARCPRWRSRTWSPSATSPSVAQRLEMVRRIAGEIEGYVVELGTDGRLLALQLDELIAGVDADRELVVRDYLPGRPARRAPPSDVLADLDALSPDRAARPRRGRPGARASAPASTSTPPVSPRGYRLLAKVPRLPGDRRRPARRALRQPAEAARRQHRRPAGRRRRRRARGPAASARACPGWPSPPSSSATSERSAEPVGLAD